MRGGGGDGDRLRWRERRRSATAFCNRLDKDLPGLEGPTETQDDLDHLVARYDSLAGVAPLAIQDDWDQLTELIHTAVSVVPTDAESVQKVIDATYATERGTARRDLGDVDLRVDDAGGARPRGHDHHRGAGDDAGAVTGARTAGGSGQASPRWVITLSTMP